MPSGCSRSLELVCDFIDAGLGAALVTLIARRASNADTADGLVADGDGALREPFRRIGRLAVGQPVPRRRRRSAIKWRRPSILMRRKPGRPSAHPSVYRGEREIIARN